jgi:PDZ domain
MTSTRSFNKATRIALPLVLLLASSTALLAEVEAPKHRVKSATIDGSGSIMLSNEYEGGSQAIFYGDATFVVTIDTGDVVKVVLKNGKFSAFFNDKPIDAPRIVTDNGGVRVLGKAGDTLFEAKIPNLHRAKPRVMLGVMVSPPDTAMATQLGLKRDAVVVTQIIPGTPAAKAGLMPYDVLLKFDGKLVTQTTLTDAIGEIKAGDTVTLNVLRDGKPQELVATMESVPYEAWAPLASGRGGIDMFFDSPQRARLTLPDGSLKVDEKQLKAFQRRYESMAHGLQSWEQGDVGKALRDQLETIRTDTTLNEAKRKEITEALTRTLESIKEYTIDIELPPIELFNNRNNDRGAVVFRERGQRRGPRGTQTSSSARLDSMEKRLTKIEYLLQKLLERESPPPKTDKKGI